MPKLQLTYAPEQGEPRSYQFDVDAIKDIETDVIEAVGGVTWDTFGEWVDKFQRGSFRAWKAALYLAMLREQPELDFDDLHLTVQELQIEEMPTFPEGKDKPAAEGTDSP